MAELLTFGYRLNAHESAGMAARAEGIDALIVNTCAVTHEAEQQARQAIRRAARECPQHPIAVTGCAATIAPAARAALPGVLRVVVNDVRLLPITWDIRPAPPAFGTLFGIGARATVAVQHGCDHACTFCVIRRGRGPARSVPVRAVVATERAAVAAGFDEVVLGGVDIASYGAGLLGRPPLGQLVRRLLALVPGLPRLRLSSIDPAAIDLDLWRALAKEPWLQVPPAIRRARAAAWRASGAVTSTAFLPGLVGCEADGLIEADGRGYSVPFAPCRITGPHRAIRRVRLSAVAGDLLEAA